MRFVTPKSLDQLDMQTLHRVRERLVTERTRLINQMRAILFERNLTVPKGAWNVAKQIPEILKDETNGLSPRIRTLLEVLQDECLELEKKIADYDAEFDRTSRAEKSCARLRTIPGIGPLTATALVAAVGNGSAMARGRDLSAWIGLVPRQRSTGGKSRLRRITKRGNPYLRKMLIHGARSICHSQRGRDTPLANWISGLISRMPMNKVFVAIANKLARIAWAVLRSGQEFNMSALAR
jgi:transposase